MSKPYHKIIYGTRGPATWDGQTEEIIGATSFVNGAFLLALRMSKALPLGTVVTVAGQPWKLISEKPATVRGMRVYEVEKPVPSAQV